jgi:polyphosphate kinase
MSATSSTDLNEPALYLNRELSLLDFNARVLDQARDPQIPLLERLRFLTICSTNLDEFFEIRVAGLKQQLAFGVEADEADGLSARVVLGRISEEAHGLVAAQYQLLNEELLPALEAQGIRLLKRAEWSSRAQRWIKRYFTREVLPVLTPMGLDPAHPFPRIQNKSLNFIVSVVGPDDFGRDTKVAILQVPRSLPRLIALPKETGEAPHDFVLLSSIVHAHIGQVFPGMEVTGCFQFRVTRNSDLWVDEEEVDDLLRAVKGELSGRNYGDAVRLEVAENCTEDMARFLLETFDLEERDLYKVNGPVNLHRVMALHELVDRQDLKYRPFVPRLPRRLRNERDLFTVLRRGDLLLHHPFDTFAPVIEFLRQAAADPDVLAIKQTLYRTGPESPVVEALIEAARAGKEVTVVVELRARFDEAANINLATRLQQAGANVVYGIVGYKAHAKMLMIVRREQGRLRRYVHLGTGNYHTRTARSYTDLSVLTCNREMGEDVHKLFTQLTGLGKVGGLKKLLQSPFTLQHRLIESIEREARNALAGRPSRIIAKMNALTEPGIIQALYRASQAGVTIDLIVRGVCCLRPGVPGVSDNIRVRSIIGRFLEHTRIFYFLAGGQEEIWCASADWMQRNFFRRVEIGFPIEDARVRERVLVDGLEPYLADNLQAWALESDGKWRRVRSGKAHPVAAQQVLLERLCGLRDEQLQPQAPEDFGLVLEVGARQGVAAEPAAGKGELEPSVADGQLERRERNWTPAAVEQDGKPQQDTELEPQRRAQ